MDARELLTGPLSNKVGRPIEIGDTKLDPSSLMPYRDVSVEGNFMLRMPVEEAQDMIALGFTEETILDWMVNVIREKLGMKVPPRPWIYPDPSKTREQLLHNLKVRTVEMKLDPAERQLSEEALTYFIDHMLPALKVPVVPMPQPAWMLFVDEGSAITRVNLLASSYWIEPEQDIRKPVQLAELLLDLIETHFAQAREEVPDLSRLYFCPYVLLHPVKRQRQKDKPEQPSKWWLRYAIHGRREETT